MSSFGGIEMSEVDTSVFRGVQISIPDERGARIEAYYEKGLLEDEKLYLRDRIRETFPRMMLCVRFESDHMMIIVVKETHCNGETLTAIKQFLKVGLFKLSEVE